MTCPMCGYEGEGLVRHSMIRECPECGERLAVATDDLEFDPPLLEIPLLAVGEANIWIGVFQEFFLAATFAMAVVEESPLLLIWSVIGLLVTACQIWGGWQMMRRRWYWWAVAGELAAMLPFSCFWFLSGPLGLCGLVLLSQRDVWEEFL